MFTTKMRLYSLTSQYGVKTESVIRILMPLQLQKNITVSFTMSDLLLGIKYYTFRSI